MLSALKLAKSTLSTDRDNLVLWDGYARLERQRGNVGAARAVYVAALQAVHARRGGLGERVVPTEDETELWSGWAEMEWDEGEMARCLEVLVMAMGMDISRLGKSDEKAKLTLCDQRLVLLHRILRLAHRPSPCSRPIR